MSLALSCHCFIVQFEQRHLKKGKRNSKNREDFSSSNYTMSIVPSSIKTIFGHEHIWKLFQPLLLSVTVQWQGQCVGSVDGRERLFFFPQEMYVSVSKRGEKSEIFLRLFLFDLFQTLIYRRNESVFSFMELSQEKPFTLISDNVQIAARQQWNEKITTNEKEWFGSEDMKGKTVKIAELNYA